MSRADSTRPPPSQAPPRLEAAPEPARTLSPTGDPSLFGWKRTDLGRALIETAARGELPEDVQRAAVLRLGVFGLTVLFGHVGLILVSLGGRSTPASSMPWLVTGAVCGAALWLLARARRLRPEIVVTLGCGGLVLIAFALSALRHGLAIAPEALLSSWTPAAVLVVLFGALVPMQPGHMAVTATLAALTDPFALYLLGHRELFSDWQQSALVFASPAASAILAWLCSQHLHGLTRNITVAREIGSYRLEERLAIGGMGEVWIGRHNLLARPAAIKLVRPEMLLTHGVPESRRLLQLFEREAQITARLTSPHTVHVYDYGVTKDGTFFYVMELLHGFDLQSLVELFGRQSPSRVVHLLLQAVESLHEAHLHQLVHRDLKPANILICRYGGEVDFLKIVDFGLVMDRRPTAEELERPGLIGTPSVMAPEMVRFNAPVDQRADIYALGCVAYWLLTGQRAFDALNRADMLIMHAHQKPVAPSKRAGVALPPDLEKLVLDCLEKNPDKRPQTARHLADRLQALTLPPWTRNDREAWWLAHPPPALESPIGHARHSRPAPGD